MLVVRINQLRARWQRRVSGRPRRLAAMLAADALPYVREHGSVGTSDLPALATTALALMGEAPTTFPLSTRVELGAADALPLMSSNAATIGDAALAGADLMELARASVVVAALTFAGVDGNREAFAELCRTGHAVRRCAPGAAGRMRALTDGATPAARIQDPFGLRTLPQVHGVTIDALRRLDEVVRLLANAPSENPVFLEGSDGRDQIAHHGGFHASYLSAALDAATLAVAESATLALARIAILIDPSATGLRRSSVTDARVVGRHGARVRGSVRSRRRPRARNADRPPDGRPLPWAEEVASFASLAARQAGRRGGAGAVAARLRAGRRGPCVARQELLARQRVARPSDRRCAPSFRTIWWIAI